MKRKNKNRNVARKERPLTAAELKKIAAGLLLRREEICKTKWAVDTAADAMQKRVVG